MKLTSLAVAFSSTGLLLQPVSSWGNLGHRTIALLSQKHFTSLGQAYAESLLQGEEISEASIWADKYKDTTGGSYSASWHFVDARDEAPTLCSVDFDRDCDAKRVCILAAVANMTSRLEDDRLAKEERAMAFKFLIHLVGDLHMPLHVEGIERGGNDIKVLFAGVTTNLHFVWDVLIPQKLTASTETTEVEAARNWAARLFKTPDRHSYRQEYLEDLNLLVLDWAREANSWVCKYVLAEGTDCIQGQELSGSYYNDSVHIVENLVERAGTRLATVVNFLAYRESKREIGLLANGEL